MSGNSFLLDTNIILYLLSGEKKIAEVINHAQWHVSFITELELLSFKSLAGAEKEAITKFLDNCLVTDINEEIKQHTIQIRKNTKLPLPDCIIGATAMYLDIPLFTADKDFKKIKALPLILFEEQSR
jgi:predicted nucleic acid-binding protein